MSHWFSQGKSPKIKEKPSEKVVRVPDGFWVKCSSCGEILQADALKENLGVCPECSFHFRMGAWDRIALLCGDEFEEFDSKLVSIDPLDFTDSRSYAERLESAQKSTQLSDAIIAGKGSIHDVDTILGVFEFRFMGGSMGAVVGEKVSRCFERALDEKLPCVLITASGGARMQEGILSLMQMAKTSALAGKMKKEGLAYLSVLTDPTTGGVAASFAMLGDVILAEPGALIGFAGPRVIESTMRQSLPPGFQRAEFLVKHGFLDAVVSRKDLSQTIARLLGFLHRRTWVKGS
ncbi:MAG TPA: acetyl-CoA carboxylase, carboxyltransferase subunit beta [Oligoflexia bacterium]|nr:acetyl-CoA carboxylase, carboxyltransferase subunit beta [Oligoflexia bacterium]